MRSATLEANSLPNIDGERPLKHEQARTRLKRSVNCTATNHCKLRRLSSTDLAFPAASQMLSFPSPSRDSTERKSPRRRELKERSTSRKRTGSPSERSSYFSKDPTQITSGADLLRNSRVSPVSKVTFATTPSAGAVEPQPSRKPATPFEVCHHGAFPGPAFFPFSGLPLEPALVLPPWPVLKSARSSSSMSQ